jgi:hypothetical protein
MHYRYKEGISARAHKSRPAIACTPIPVLGRAHVLEMIVFRRAPIDLLDMNHPELEEPERQDSEKETVTL